MATPRYLVRQQVAEPAETGWPPPAGCGDVGLTEGWQFRGVGGAEVPELPPWMAAPAVAGRRVRHRAPRCPGTVPR